MKKINVFYSTLIASVLAVTTHKLIRKFNGNVAHFNPGSYLTPNNSVKKGKLKTKSKRFEKEQDYVRKYITLKEYGTEN